MCLPGSGLLHARLMPRVLCQVTSVSFTGMQQQRLSLLESFLKLIPPALP